MRERISVMGCAGGVDSEGKVLGAVGCRGCALSVIPGTVCC